MIFYFQTINNYHYDIYIPELLVFFHFFHGLYTYCIYFIILFIVVLDYPIHCTFILFVFWFRYSSILNKFLISATFSITAHIKARRLLEGGTFSDLTVNAAPFIWSPALITLHKKWRFPLKISLVNVTHIYWRNP